jgi:hypothetical protein
MGMGASVEAVEQGLLTGLQGRAEFVAILLPQLIGEAAHGEAPVQAVLGRGQGRNVGE